MSVEKEASKKVLSTFKEEEEGDEYEAVVQVLPKEKSFNDLILCHYQGVWVPNLFLRGVISAQRNFLARDDDIIVASCPKSGSNWLRALAVAIVYGPRDSPFSLRNSPLLQKNPNDIVPLLDECNDRLENFDNDKTPRLFTTHMSYDSLPTSIKTSSCKIVYIARNPMDQFVSLWHFQGKFLCTDAERRSLEECFDRFCRGIHAHGPFWDHVLGFWKASLEKSEKILFLKYEDVKKDPLSNIKRLAEFMGFSFSEEEVKQGLVEEVVKCCSIERMKNLEANKNGMLRGCIPRSAYFRKGEVGDSKNFLTPVMIERMEKIMQEKYGHYPGLDFNYSF